MSATESKSPVGGESLSEATRAAASAAITAAPSPAPAPAASSAAQYGVNADPVTLTRFVLTQQRKHPDARGDLTMVLSAIATAAKSVSAAVRRAGLAGLLGAHVGGGANASGDLQKKLDVVANDVFKNLLASTGCVGVMASEEDDAAILVGEGGGSSSHAYALVFDPLDGSSVIDCNGTVGSIFGVYRRDPVGAPCAADALRRGRDLVAGGYALYGASTQLVLGLRGSGVTLFTRECRRVACALPSSERRSSPPSLRELAPLTPPRTPSHPPPHPTSPPLPHPRSQRPRQLKWASCRGY